MPVIGALLFSLFARSAHAADSCPVLPADEIAAHATHIVLFNGMWTSFADARADMVALRENYGNVGPHGEPLRYAVLYHQSSKRNAYSGLVRTFDDLLADEQDGALAGRIELFSSALHCGGPWWDAIIDAMPSFETFLVRDVTPAMQAATASDMGAMLDALPMADDFVCANAQLEEWDRDNLVLVGHSEGDLFAQALGDLLESTYRRGAVASLHIAPATVPPAGEPYLLADIDFLINRIVGASREVPAVNIEATKKPSELHECLGHDLGDVYLTDFDLSRAVHDTLDDIVGTMP